MANPYPRLFNLFAFVVLACAIYVNFFRSPDVAESHSKTIVTRKITPSQEQENRTLLAKAEQKK